jgi:hypothetical protein
VLVITVSVTTTLVQVMPALLASKEVVTAPHASNTQPVHMPGIDPLVLVIIVEFALLCKVVGV